MGDVGDFWRDVEAARGKRHGRGRPAATLVEFTKQHKALGFIRHSLWHWQIRLSGGLLDYWPSKNKWRYLNRNHTGAYAHLKAFVKANALQSPSEPLNARTQGVEVGR